MIYKQILLPFWKKYYDYEFLIGDSNKSAFSILKNIKEQIALSGPAKSGKKHLASLASKEFGFDCFLLSAFDSKKFLDQYEELKKNNKPAVWIIDMDLNLVVKDIRSRICAMFQAEIEELSDDLFFSIFENRLKRLSIPLKVDWFNCCFSWMPKTFFALDSCVEFISANPGVSHKALKQFILESFK